MNAYGSRFVGKLARGFFILKLKKRKEGRKLKKNMAL